MVLQARSRHTIRDILYVTYSMSQIAFEEVFRIMSISRTENFSFEIVMSEFEFSDLKTTKGGSLEQSSLINEAVRNLKSHHLRGLHLREYDSDFMANRHSTCFEIIYINILSNRIQ